MTSRHKGKSQGEAKEKRIVVAECSEGRQGQKALKERKFNPTAPLTGGTRMAILEQVFPLLFFNKRLYNGLLPEISQEISQIS